MLLLLFALSTLLWKSDVFKGEQHDPLKWCMLTLIVIINSEPAKNTYICIKKHANIYEVAEGLDPKARMFSVYLVPLSILGFSQRPGVMIDVRTGDCKLGDRRLVTFVFLRKPERPAGENVRYISSAPKSDTAPALFLHFISFNICPIVCNCY